MSEKNIVLLYGEWSVAGNRFHSGAPLSISYERGLTGSESSFFTWAKQLSEVPGYNVHIYAPFEEGAAISGLGKVRIHGIEDWNGYQSDDIVISWNEPDLLRCCHSKSVRVVNQQLNDFNYCQDGWQKHVDAILFPSAHHMTFMRDSCGLSSDIHLGVMENGWSKSIEYRSVPTVGKRVRDRRNVCYLSSPDRGLHWLLSMWDQVHEQCPESKLEIGYGAMKWAEANAHLIESPSPVHHEFGKRATFIKNWKACYDKSGRSDVVFHQERSAELVADILARCAVLAYTCDPILPTEGFSVTTVEAAAAGCVPLVSNVDALGTIYPGLAYLPRPSKANISAWVDAIVDEVKYPSEQLKERCRNVAALYEYSSLLPHVKRQLDFIRRKS